MRARERSQPPGVSPLILCSKSTWTPAIRREHAFAQLGARAGLPVVFLERPLDIRSLRGTAGTARWLHAASARPVTPVAGQVTIVATAALAPGHRGELAQRLEARRLARDLARVTGLSSATVVATAPWQWPALRRLRVRRRVFDCADDWAALLPRRRNALSTLMREIAAEADAVVTANPDMRSRFASNVTIVRNGVGEELLAAPATPQPRDARCMVYAGTLSERLDLGFLREVMNRLGGWSLDLYGPCQYAGLQERPSPALRALLAEFSGRVRWHGPIARGRLAAAIDAAAVAIIVHRVSHVGGQDSMKVYDYAARARPIVSTVPVGLDSTPVDDVVTVAPTPAGFAAAVERSSQAAAPELAELRRWAEGQSYPERWREWQAAVLGSGR